MARPKRIYTPEKEHAQDPIEEVEIPEPVKEVMFKSNRIGSFRICKETWAKGESKPVSDDLQNESAFKLAVELGHIVEV